MKTNTKWLTQQHYQGFTFGRATSEDENPGRQRIGIHHILDVLLIVLTKIIKCCMTFREKRRRKKRQNSRLVRAPRHKTTGTQLKGWLLDLLGVW